MAAPQFQSCAPVFCGCKLCKDDGSTWLHDKTCAVLHCSSQLLGESCYPWDRQALLDRQTWRRIVLLPQAYLFIAKTTLEIDSLCSLSRMAAVALKRNGIHGKDKPCDALYSCRRRSSVTKSHVDLVNGLVLGVTTSNNFLSESCHL